jgi:transposase
MCQLHLDYIARLNQMIATLDAQVEEMMIPFARKRDLLATIPGIGTKAAAAIISEIGTSPGEFFTTGAHLASWAGLCPGNHESAGKRKHGKPRKGSQHLQPLLVECAWAAVRTSGRLNARYHRLVRRFGGYRNPAARNGPSSPSRTPSPWSSGT